MTTIETLQRIIEESPSEAAIGEAEKMAADILRIAEERGVPCETWEARQLSGAGRLRAACRQAYVAEWAKGLYEQWPNRETEPPIEAATARQNQDRDRAYDLAVILDAAASGSGGGLVAPGSGSRRCIPLPCPSWSGKGPERTGVGGGPAWTAAIDYVRIELCGRTVNQESIDHALNLADKLQRCDGWGDIVMGLREYYEVERRDSLLDIHRDLLDSIGTSTA